MSAAQNPWTAALIWHSIGYAMRYRIHSHRAEFEVFQITSCEDGVPTYRAREPVTETPTMDEAEKVMEGSIKWDGCSNFSFDDCVHLCGTEGWKTFLLMQQRVFCALIGSIPEVDRDESLAAQGWREPPRSED